MSFLNTKQISAIDLLVSITIYAFEDSLLTSALPEGLTLDVDHRVLTQCIHNTLQQNPNLTPIRLAETLS